MFLLIIKLWALLTEAWSPRVVLFFLFPPFLSLFFFQDDSLEHKCFIGFLCKWKKIKPLSLIFYLSLIAYAIILRVHLDPAGAGPRQYHYFIPCTKVHSKWIKDLNVGLEVIKFLEENISNNLTDLGLGGIFMDLNPK